MLALWPVGQTVYGRWSQRNLAQEFAREEKSFPKHPPKVKATKVVAPRKAVIAPWPLTKITISDISLDSYVVQGWDESNLRRGPAHYERSSPPGEGNCVIAGHRNVYGSPFGDLDRLMAGENIVLSNRNGTFNYVVDSISSVSATDWSVTAPPPPGGIPVLTLLTCTLPHTPSRVMIKALLVQ